MKLILAAAAVVLLIVLVPAILAGLKFLLIVATLGTVGFVVAYVLMTYTDNR